MKERLKKFVKYKKIGQNKFESICGIGRGTINNMKNNLTIKTLQKISDVYNDLNIDWLLTGEGEMLLGTATHVNPVANNAVDVSAIVRGFLTEIAAQREHYEKIIAVQRAHYERLITEIAKSQDVRKNIVGGALSARV